MAAAITWDFEEKGQLVSASESFTISSDMPAVPRKAALKYVLKDAKGATTINRKVHVIAQMRSRLAASKRV